MRYFTLPVHFDQKIYMAGHFYLIPLIPYFNDNGRFSLLAISLQQVRLFEGSRHSISEVITHEDVPRRLEDVVGYDFTQKSLQFRTQQGGDANAMFHGHGSGKDDEDPEIERYFRAVDAGLKQMTGDDQVPLVLAGHFQDLSAGGKTSTEIGEIVPSAVEGRVDTLFIRKGEDMMGIYDMTERRVEVDEERPNNVSLFNMAAIHTLENGGKVYTTPSGQMPMEETTINALMRY